MKILVINGSPKGKNSNTMCLTNAFLEGINKAEVRVIDVANSKIAPCKGCFCCWNKTPGKCIWNDDMQYVIDSELWADVIIWSFPLYYFNVPGGLKNLIDRQLPMNLPFMAERTDGIGSGSHPTRYDMSGKRHVIISTCGFYSADKNYDSVRLMFDHMCGANAYEMLVCGQGELFRVPELKSRTNEYLETVKKAGSEYESGKISDETKALLSELLYPKEVFEAMADASWGISKDGSGAVDETLAFTRQMAALYNKDSYDGKDRILEISYIDKDKTYQILLGKDGSQVYEDLSLTPTTTIETTWDVWKSISSGEIRGDVALMQKMYKVKGDFDLMIHWNQYFGSASSKKRGVSNPVEKDKKKPSMLVMLIPWMVFWILVSINKQVGPVIVLLVCSLLPLISYRVKTTIYDLISLFLVGGLSAGAMLFENVDAWIVAGYLGFGLLWLISCFTKEPLCAAYVKYNYNGEDALNNPIFMKTNYIIAAGWGVLYIIVSIMTLVLYKKGLYTLSMIFNNSAPIVMGIFTVWFEKWYPARVASGK